MKMRRWWFSLLMLGVLAACDEGGDALGPVGPAPPNAPPAADLSFPFMTVDGGKLVVTGRLYDATQFARPAQVCFVSDHNAWANCRSRPVSLTGSAYVFDPAAHAADFDRTGTWGKCLRLGAVDVSTIPSSGDISKAQWLPVQEFISRRGGFSNLTAEQKAQLRFEAGTNKNPMMAVLFNKSGTVDIGCKTVSS